MLHPIVKSVKPVPLPSLWSLVLGQKEDAGRVRVIPPRLRPSLNDVIAEDNGVGIPRQPVLGLGLLGMKERVQALGGTISMERRASGGTRIAASLPLPNDDEDEG